MSIDPEAFKAAYDRMPLWRRDQFDAHMRQAAAVIRRICEVMERWEAEGVAAAERHANQEDA